MFIQFLGANNVWKWTVTDVSEEYTAFIFRVTFYRVSGQDNYKGRQSEPWDGSVCFCRIVTTAFERATD
jgi:hypothetical protein